MTQAPKPPTEFSLEAEALHADHLQMAGAAGELAVTHAITPAEEATNVTPNPYERFTSEQLTQIRVNIADSVVTGVRKYDAAEVVRATTNLAGIQREMETRGLVPAPTHKRGETVDNVIYTTELDDDLRKTIADKIIAVDGGRTILGAVRTGLPEMTGTRGSEEWTQSVETAGILSMILRQIRNDTGTEFDSPSNPYVTQPTEVLQANLARLKQTIGELNASGKDSSQFRSNVMLIGQVLKSRQ